LLKSFRSVREGGNIQRMENDSKAGFSMPWRLSGYLVLAAATIFVVRIVYEETALTWTNGPQMVGFTIFHGVMPFYLVAFFIGILGGLLWLAASLIALVWKKFRVPLIDWIPIALLLVLAAVLTIPEGIWIELMLRTGGRSQYEYAFMADAAGKGNQRLVKFLLDKGYNIEGGDGASPLCAAADGGQKEMVSFLISRGADVNRKQGHGQDTPLIYAAAAGHLEAVKFLIEKGAQPARRTSKNTRPRILRKNPNSLMSRNICPNTLARTQQSSRATILAFLLASIRNGQHCF
jgi:hypothetical protein